MDNSSTNPSSSSSSSSRAPPKLKREIRIPVLQIQKLQQIPAISKGKDSISNEEAIVSPVLTAPPQLEPVVDTPTCPMIIDTSSDQEEDAVEETLNKRPPTPPPPAALVGLGRRERRCSLSCTADKNPTPDKGKKRKPNNSSTEEPTRKIIQSIFAKPKPQRPQRSRRGKAKSGPKNKAKALKGTQASNFLKIKFESASSRRLRREEEQAAAEAEAAEKDAKNAGEMELVDDDDEFEDEHVQKSSKKEDVKSEVDDNEEEEEEVNEKSPEELLGGKKIKDEEEEEGSSKKSEEDDGDLSDQDDWKPVRAAMVAAMELVAKKQVTDDMRVERRVRKPNVKPLPPKGRGRRTIFKKMTKPVQACMQTMEPIVMQSMYFNGNYHQKGDIVYLLPASYLNPETSSDDDDDSNSDNEIEPDSDRFFQVRGFLQIDHFKETLASVLHLKPKADRSDEAPFPFDTSMFEPDYERGEIMVHMQQLKHVLHCPHDLYHGHDQNYNVLTPGTIYSRLGYQFYNQQINYPLPPEENDNNNDAAEDGDEDDENKNENDNGNIESSQSSGSTTTSQQSIVS